MSKGSARFGAGRPGYKVKSEQLQWIGVRDLSRRQLLNRQSSFTWSWSRGGEATGSISVNVYPQCAASLVYTVTDDAGAHNINDRLSLIYKPCNFGGERPWFQCPRCTRKVAMLYLRGGRFACRRCQRVSYRSQAEDVMSRAWRKQRWIEETIGEDWQRPSGMRQHTHARLLDQLADCQQKQDTVFCISAGRLLASFERQLGGAEKSEAMVWRKPACFSH